MYNSSITRPSSTESREILYPWHAWFGRLVWVYGTRVCHGRSIARYGLEQRHDARGIEIAQWMFETAACCHMHMAGEPVTSVDALRDLRNLLSRSVPRSPEDVLQGQHPSLSLDRSANAILTDPTTMDDATGADPSFSEGTRAGTSCLGTFGSRPCSYWREYFANTTTEGCPPRTDRGGPLIESAKSNGINLHAYLTHVLIRLPTAKAMDLDALLPWNYRPQPSVGHQRPLIAASATAVDVRSPYAYALTQRLASGVSAYGSVRRGGRQARGVSPRIDRGAPTPLRRTSASLLQRKRALCVRTRSRASTNRSALLNTRRADSWAPCDPLVPSRSPAGRQFPRPSPT